MSRASSSHSTRLTLYLSLLFLAAFVGSCRSEADSRVTVTEVVEVAGQEIVVTRLIDVPQVTETPARMVETRKLPVQLDLGYVGNLPDLDPAKPLSDSGQDLVENLFVGLTTLNPESQLIEPQLAESWRASGDGLTWTFQLRDDIYWVRGVDTSGDSPELANIERVRPVDAYDVAFAIQRSCMQSTGSPDQHILFVIEGCQLASTLPIESMPAEEAAVAEEVQEGLVQVIALDDHTVEFRLSEPAAYLPTLLSLPATRPVPRELVSELGSQWRFANSDDFAGGWQTPENLITSGPFVPSTTRFNDEEAFLVRNPLWPISPEGNIDQIEIRWLEDDMNRLDLWLQKQVDLSPLPAEQRDQILEQSPARATLVPNQTVFYIGLGFDSEAFAEPEVRRAFSAAIDRELLVEQMFGERGRAMRHFTPPGVMGAPAIDEVGVGYSPDYARQQMSQSTFRACNLMPPFTLMVSTADLSLLQAELLRDMWGAELDCNVEQIAIEQVSFGELLSQTAADSSQPRPDAWELAWPPFFPDAHNVLSQLLHCRRGENRQKRPCSQIDQLLDRANRTVDSAERQALYRQVESMLFGENGAMPLIPLYVRGDYVLIQSWLKFQPAFFGGEQFERFWIDEELKRLERSRG